jgi:thiol-disulfide isomerase/thioredoxin
MGMSKPSRKIFVVISALAVMAVSLFLIASTLYSPPIPSIPVQPTVIVFEPDSVEMGELSPDVAKTVVIRLRNVSDRPLLVTTAVASCGCTTSTWPTDPIAPGEFAEAGVTVKPSKEQGGETLMKTVTYLVEDVGPVTVFVRGHVAKLPSSETAAPQPPSGAAVSSATATATATAAPPSTAKQSPFRRSNPTVFPGSRLPFPNLATWVQGEPATAWAPGTVYVFEFFTTTCSHCKEFAETVEGYVREYGAKGMRFVAVTDEEAPKVKAWLDSPEKKDHVPYSVVSDPDRSAIMQMQNGTFRNFNPRFFIVKDGIVQWFGHPKEAAEPLAKIAAGTWDPASVRLAIDLDGVAALAKNYLDNIARECEKTDDWKPMLTGIDSVIAGIPERAGVYESQRFTVMIGLCDMGDAGYDYGREVAKRHPQEMATIRSLSRAILQSPYVKNRNLDLGMEFALAADALAKGEDARVADTVALAHFSKGDRAKAIEHEERAVRLEKDPRQREVYEKALEKYRTATPGPEPARPHPGVKPVGGQVISGSAATPAPPADSPQSAP